MSSRDVDLHIRKFPEPQQSTLRALRQTIRQILPEAEEVISYGFPGYRFQGKIICGFDGFKNHCSFFPHSSLVIPELESELASYKTSKGAIQFGIDKSLPKLLVKKLISTRLRQLGLAKN